MKESTTGGNEDDQENAGKQDLRRMTSQGWQVKAQDRQAWSRMEREAKVHSGLMMTMMFLGLLNDILGTV
jgi:hypothetical protein